MLISIDSIVRDLEVQGSPLTATEAINLVRRRLASYIGIYVPRPERPTGAALVAAVGRDNIARCWPRLATALARSGPPPITEAPPTGAAQPGSLQEIEAGEQRRERAERRRHADDEAQRHAEQVRAEAEAASAADAERTAELQRRDAQQRELSRAAQARQDARDQQARDAAEREQQVQAAANAERNAAQQAEELRRQVRDRLKREASDRERRAEAVAEASRLEAARAEETKRQAEIDQAAAAHRQQQAALLQQRAATLAKAQADAEATRRAADEARKLAEESDRLAAERAATEQAAERLKRPECLEADRVAADYPNLQGQAALVTLAQVAVAFEAGMHVEACAATRKIYTAAERMRSAAARCEPAEAVLSNDLASALRTIILEQGC